MSYQYLILSEEPTVDRIELEKYIVIENKLIDIKIFLYNMIIN